MGPGQGAKQPSKHGVSFEAARLVFDDVFALDRFDAGSGHSKPVYHHRGGERHPADGRLYGARRTHAHHLSEKSDAV